ncbi:GNAT family N-acetyltransferase [Streptomyces antimicrobicus]|uniref:GNAT family N-acetyltransferase n=1 Tax=Streptomyces antimicrobicus TaxID=2883108 RepID=A0ABS8BEH2_9ACTN|nr:GNAT family N-acetyltransferase [Streptomyces antimicrobicus]MCB5182911.1 GNAT family N-acetyltransferase [Streptomyces antimicrobicus]
MTFETDVRDLYDAEERRGAVTDRPGAVVERAGAVVRQCAPDGGWNAVVWSDLREDTADAEIAAQVAYFAGAGVPRFEWKLYGHDRPADLGERLGAAGFVAEPAETLMVARTAEVGAEPPALPDGVRIEEVTDAAGVDLMMEAHRLAFDEDHPGLREQLLGRLEAAPQTLMALVALADGRPVSAARMEIRPGGSFAGLWGGGTAPAWRGKGIYRALVAHRAAEAARRGIPYLQVDASPDSRPILHRLGFHALTTTTPYIWTNPTTT